MKKTTTKATTTTAPTRVRRHNSGSNMFRNTGIAMAVVTLLFVIFLLERTSNAVDELRRLEAQSGCRLDVSNAEVILSQPIRIVRHKDIFSNDEIDVMKTLSTLCIQHHEADQKTAANIFSLDGRRFVFTETRQWLRVTLQRLSVAGHVPYEFLHQRTFILEMKEGKAFDFDPSSLLHIDSDDPNDLNDINDLDLDFQNNQADANSGLIVVGLSLFCLEGCEGEIEIKDSKNVDAVVRHHSLPLRVGDSVFVWLWDLTHRLRLDPSRLSPNSLIGLQLFVCPYEEWNYHENILFNTA